MITRFLDDYPAIEIELLLANDAVNLIEQKIDLAIRGRIEIEDNLITRKLGESQIAICASPDYIARHGAPAVPEDLQDHCCLHFSGRRWGRKWHMRRRDEQRPGRPQIFNLSAGSTFLSDSGKRTDSITARR